MKSLALYTGFTLAILLLYNTLPAHPQAECFESTDCKYVQIETEHGAQRMVYICE